MAFLKKLFAPRAGGGVNANLNLAMAQARALAQKQKSFLEYHRQRVLTNMAKSGTAATPDAGAKPSYDWLGNLGGKDDTHGPA